MERWTRGKEVRGLQLTGTGEVDGDDHRQVAQNVYTLHRSSGEIRSVGKDYPNLVERPHHVCVGHNVATFD